MNVKISNKKLKMESFDFMTVNAVQLQLVTFDDFVKCDIILFVPRGKKELEEYVPVILDTQIYGETYDDAIDRGLLFASAIAEDTFSEILVFDAEGDLIDTLDLNDF